MIDTIKGFFVPGSTLFLLVGQAVAVALLFGPARAQRWGRRLLVGLLAGYLFLAMPLASDGLVFWLSRGYRSLNAKDAAALPTRTIVVLGNGVQWRRADGAALDALNLPSAFGALEAARLYRLLGEPKVLVSGGMHDRVGLRYEADVMKEALVELGVAAEDIDLERRSQTTREQAMNVGDWLRVQGVDHFVLVTSPDHMNRAVRSFRKVGLQATPSISRLRYGGTRPVFWPTVFALEGSQSAIYEYMASLYYWSRGWL